MKYAAGFTVIVRLAAARRRVWLGGVVLAGLVGVLVVFLQPASAQNENEKKVRICHATSSESNPYTSPEPAIANNGDLNGGHLTHTGPVFPAADWGDIIPPYDYVDENGKAQVFPGYNWSPEGQAIWELGCTPGLKPLKPILECVEDRAGRWVPGALRLRQPEPEDQGAVRERVRPVVGEWSAADAVRAGSGRGCVPGAVGREEPLTWHLTGNEVTATAGSNRCEGSITIMKVLNPTERPGSLQPQNRRRHRGRRRVRWRWRQHRDGRRQRRAAHGR